ncbi:MULTISPECIES: TetR/AcrR family transcriptional regulator [Burkholderia]|uniref:TetR/AcrR family transcriptional regulator n=1 Tax=Burkholderia TaxID=32008 RepID=UPI000A7124A9|nr:MULTISPECIES: TetR/AcrR family transcriptional regulator [Burkholderia]
MQERTRAAHLGPERRRPQVLDAALRIAVTRGLAGVSMEAIAQALGVTRPVVYACFASREELIDALLEREERRLFDGVISALPHEPPFGDPKQWMTAGFQALLKVVAEHADSWRLVLAADHDRDAVERYGNARRRVAQQVGALMGPMMKKAGVKQIDKKLPVLVEIFMSLGDGAVRAMLDDEQQWTPDELGAYVGRIVLGGFMKA